MKTAIVRAANGFGIFNRDEWDSFRSEGRFVINIGFGLSLLGYDVNIVYGDWRTLDKPKKTWNNICISRDPIKDYYDVSLSFDLRPITRFGKCIIMGYAPEHALHAKHFMDDTNTEVTYVCPFKYLLDYVRSNSPIPVQYIPPLYPIPSINIGFLPYSFDPNLPELKIFLYYSSWKNSTDEKWAHKEQLILDYLKSMGYKLKVCVQIESKESIERCQIMNHEMNFFYSNENNYKNVIDMLRSVDLCITVGGRFMNGNSLNDIISLGKPLIYIADGILQSGDIFMNHLYNFPDDLIYIQESDSDSITKLDRIIHNLKDTCMKFRDIFRDHDFNIWKDIVKDIFS